MDLALQGRPAWKEVVGVLVACALLLFLLAKLDGAAAQHESTRARAQIAERRSQAPERETRVGISARGPIAVPKEAGATADAAGEGQDGDRPGGVSNAVLALFAGCGIMMCLAGTALLVRSR